MSGVQIKELEAQLDAAYAEEEKADRVVTDLDELPFTYEHLSREWLTKLLCAGHDGAEVIAFEAEDVDELDRGHKRILLTYNDRGRAAGLPASVFCKDSQRRGLRLFNSPLMETEAGFYRDVQPLLGLETPNCLHAAYDPRSFNSLLVFEDMGDLGAEFCTEATPITRERAESQLDHLARLHARFHGELDSNPSLAAFGGFPAVWDWMQAFFRGKFSDEANRGFLASEAVIPPRLFDRFESVWPLTEKAVEIQRSRAVTLTHNDAHIRNWYVSPDGEMRLADWQLVGRGDWSFEVAFTMCTSLTVEDRRSWDRELIEVYLERLAAHGGPRIELADAWDSFRRQLFVCLAWWTPVVKTSADFEFESLDSAFENIRRISAAIDDLDSFEAMDKA